MPVIEPCDYNTDVFTRDEIILKETISTHICAKIKEIDRKEIPKNIKINSLGIVSNQLVLKITIEYNVNTSTYGYGSMISLDKSDELFNSLKDKVNMEIYGSAKRDDPYLDYSNLIFAITKKVELKVTQNKSELYIAKYNDVEKALIRTIHKGVGRVSIFSTVTIGYDTKIGTMYYGVIDNTEKPNCCIKILEQVYIDFIAKLKNDGLYCPINEPISKEKTALGWSDKYYTYTNRVQFISILNAIGRIGCEESIKLKLTQQPKDVAMSSNSPAANTISAEARCMMEFIVEKCESITKLLGKNTTPEINIRQAIGDTIVFHIIDNSTSSHQVLRIGRPYRYTAFIELYEHITGNKAIAITAIASQDGEYPLTIKYDQLAKLRASINCYMDDKVFQTDLVACCKKNYPEIPKEILNDLDPLWLHTQRKIVKNMDAEQYLNHLDMLAKNILNQYNDTKACVAKGVCEFIQKDISSDLVLGYDSLMERFKVGLQIFTEADRDLYLSLIEAKIALHTLSKKYPDINTCVHYQDDEYVIKINHVVSGSTQTNYTAIGHYHVTIHMSTHWIGTDTYNALKDLHRVTAEVIKIMKTIEDKCNCHPIKAYYTALNQK